MGRIITPKYRVEYRDNDFKSVCDASYTGRSGPINGCKTQCWSGRATIGRLKDWRDTMNKSFEKGGSNEHITKALGFIVRVGVCQIIEQKTKRVVCEFTPPLFEVV